MTILHKREWVFVFAFLISIFTKLRVSILGFGEILILLLLPYLLVKLTISGRPIKLNDFIFSSVFFIFLFVCAFSKYVNLVFELDKANQKSFFFDFSAYVFVLLSLLCVEIIIKLDSSNLIKILEKKFIILFFISTVLFCFSFISINLGPFTLRYGPFFAPLVENLHQFAMVAAVLPAFFVHHYFTGKKNVFSIVAVVISLIFIASTGSFKATVGSLLGIVFYLICNNYQNQSNLTKSYTIIIGLFTSLTLFVLASYFSIFQTIFSDADGKGARANLYSQAAAKISESPFIGYGPGAHLFLDNEHIDAHQTFLTILLQTGWLGGIFMLIFTGYVLYKIARNNILLLSLLFPIFIYALGGDIMRKFQIWVILCFIFHISTQKKDA